MILHYKRQSLGLNNLQSGRQTCMTFRKLKIASECLFIFHLFKRYMGKSELESEFVSVVFLQESLLFISRVCTIFLSRGRTTFSRLHTGTFSIDFFIIKRNVTDVHTNLLYHFNRHRIQITVFVINLFMELIRTFH